MKDIENNNFKQNIIIVLLLINLAVVVVMGGTKINDLNNRIFQINNNMSNLNN